MDKQKKIRYRRKKMRKRKLMRATLIVLLILSLLFSIGLVVVIADSIFNIGLKERASYYFCKEVDIVLDPGHGGKDPGANKGEAIEKEITLEIAHKTKTLLEDAGYDVILTRDDDTFIELNQRAEFANKRNAKVFVSIHCNSSEDGEGEGIETFYTEYKGDETKYFAETIQSCIIEHTNARNREAKTANYNVLVHTTMPSVLVEAGFLTNKSERVLLVTDEYQEKIALGISEAIKLYLTDS